MAERVPLTPPITFGTWSDAAVVFAEISSGKDFFYQVFAQVSVGSCIKRQAFRFQSKIIDCYVTKGTGCTEQPQTVQVTT